MQLGDNPDLQGIRNAVGDLRGVIKEQFPKTPVFTYVRPCSCLGVRILTRVPVFKHPAGWVDTAIGELMYLTSTSKLHKREAKDVIHVVVRDAFQC